VKDTKVWIWVIGVVCGLELLAIAIVGGAGIGAFFVLEGAFFGLEGAFFGLEGVLVVSIGAGASVIALRSLITHRSRTRSG